LPLAKTNLESGLF